MIGPRTKEQKLILVIGLILMVNVAHGASLSDEIGDEELDELLKEFIKTGAKEENMKSKDPELEPPLEISRSKDFVPLNVQTKFLKRDDCNCTKFFLCDVENPDNNVDSVEDDMESSEEGADVGLINIRLNVPEGGCSHYLDICCKKMRNESSIKISGSTKVISKKRICGKRNVGGVGFRITGNKDDEAQFGEFPWMSALTELTSIQRYPDDKPPQKFICGASLIHPQAAITAAHCLDNKTMESLRVRVGEWDTQTNDEIYPHQEVQVDQILVHPSYKRRRYLRNDIALLIFKNEVSLGPNVAPICLPSSDVNFDGKRCVASGWGKVFNLLTQHSNGKLFVWSDVPIKFKRKKYYAHKPKLIHRHLWKDSFGKHGAFQAILKSIEVPIVPKSQCQGKLRSTRLPSNFNLHESFICAGGELGKDTCRGDGGSPLVCQVPGQDYYVQYGIVSWGIGCGNDVPGVYVNVPKFTPWIENTLDILGLNTKYSRA